MRLLLFPYLFFFCAITWIVCSSWQPKKESFTIQGTISAVHGQASATKLYYTQSEEELNYDKMDVLDVRADGVFKAVINAEPNSIIYLYAVKEGYTTVRKKLVPKNSKLHNLGEISISSLHQPFDLGQIMGQRSVPQLELYKDICLRNLDATASVSEIAYFENVGAVPTDCINMDGLTLLEADIKLPGRKQSRQAYFPLRLEGNGEAFLLSPEERSPRLSSNTAQPATASPVGN